MLTRTLVVGDIHGAARALDQALSRAGFDPAADRLISLGDVCDGWPEVDRCIDRLLGCEDFVMVRGNHDEWTLDWIHTGQVALEWYANGGEGTLAAYARRAGVPEPEDHDAAADLSHLVPAEHTAFLERAVDYVIEERPDGRRALFTHAGWNPREGPEAQTEEELRWSRDFWVDAQRREAVWQGEEGRTVTGFDVVFLGHTPTLPAWSEPRPVLEVWNLDQGAGWDGPLTVMDADTHEWWQSDPVGALYPGVAGRMGGL